MFRRKNDIFSSLTSSRRYGGRSWVKLLPAKVHRHHRFSQHQPVTGYAQRTPLSQLGSYKNECQESNNKKINTTPFVSTPMRHVCVFFSEKMPGILENPLGRGMALLGCLDFCWPGNHRGAATRRRNWSCHCQIGQPMPQPIQGDGSSILQLRCIFKNHTN